MRRCLFQYMELFSVIGAGTPENPGGDFGVNCWIEAPDKGAALEWGYEEVLDAGPPVVAPGSSNRVQTLSSRRTEDGDRSSPVRTELVMARCPSRESVRRPPTYGWARPGPVRSAVAT